MRTVFSQPLCQTKVWGDNTRLVTASGEESQVESIRGQYCIPGNTLSLHLRVHRRLVFEIQSVESETFPVILCPPSNLSQVWRKSVENASNSLLPTKCHGRVSEYLYTAFPSRGYHKKTYLFKNILLSLSKSLSSSMPLCLSLTLSQVIFNTLQSHAYFNRVKTFWL